MLHVGFDQILKNYIVDMEGIIYILKIYTRILLCSTQLVMAWNVQCGIMCRYEE
jgi:hypothetical protein